jgi:flagellar hook protein FlgE
MPSISGLSAALSGINAAHTKLHASAHNVANFQTEDYKPVRTQNEAQLEGGVTTRVEEEAEPRQVDLAEEAVNQIRASVHAKANVNVIRAEMDLIGSLLDLKA